MKPKTLTQLRQELRHCIKPLEQARDRYYAACKRYDDAYNAVARKSAEMLLTKKEKR